MTLFAKLYVCNSGAETEWNNPGEADPCQAEFKDSTCSPIAYSFKNKM